MPDTEDQVMDDALAQAAGEGGTEAPAESGAETAGGSEQASPWSARDYAKTKGWLDDEQLSQFDSDQSLVDGMYEALNHTRGGYSQLEQQHQQALAQLAQLQAAQQQATQQTEQKKSDEDDPYAKWPKLPDWSDDWPALIREDGKTRDGADPLLPQKIQQHHSALARRMREFLNDPYKAGEPLWAKLKREIAADQKKEIEEALGGFKKKYEADKYVFWNAKHLINQDSGEHTPLGAAFLESAQALREMGIDDGDKIRKIFEFFMPAVNKYISPGEKKAKDDQASGDTEDKAQGKRDSFLKKNNRTPSRSGLTAQTTRQKQNGQKSFEDSLKDDEEWNAAFESGRRK